MLKKTLLVSAALAAGIAHAASYYKVSVTRVESNMHRVDDYGMSSTYYIQTKYCYQYATRQSAILVWNGRGSYTGNKLVFLDWNDKVEAECDVAMLLKEVEP